jgi:glycosyltransferase involved in cell wall biosynthesis
MGGMQFENPLGGPQPLVSIIIPCYNAGSFIKEAIQSVVEQSYSNKQIIFINDGSSDDSLKIASHFKDLIIIDQENRGVSYARNQGIKKANGEFIALLDADDFFLPANLEQKVPYLTQHPECVLVHAKEQIFEDGQREVEISHGMGGRVLNQLLNFKETVIHSPSSVLIRKTALDQTGGFDENLSTSADWDLWLRLSDIGEFGFIETPLSVYRIHGNQMHLNVRKMATDMTYSYEKARKKGLIPDKKEYRKMMANLNLTIAASFYGDEKNLGMGLKYLARSISGSPRVFFKRLLGD